VVGAGYLSRASAGAGTTWLPWEIARCALAVRLTLTQRAGAVCAPGHAPGLADAPGGRAAYAARALCRRSGDAGREHHPARLTSGAVDAGFEGLSLDQRLVLRDPGDPACCCWGFDGRPRARWRVCCLERRPEGTLRRAEITSVSACLGVAQPGHICRAPSVGIQGKIVVRVLHFQYLTDLLRMQISVERAVALASIGAWRPESRMRSKPACQHLGIDGDAEGFAGRDADSRS